MRAVLTIAGSDCSGGAGIQADIKTMSAHGVFGMSVITSVVAENTARVDAVYDIPCDMIAKQIDSVFEDIEVSAVKIGMLGNVEIMEMVAQKIRQYQPNNVIVDPVMYAKNGCPLMANDSIESLIRYIVPIATLLTPNIPEAERITGQTIESIADMQSVARDIYAMGCRYVLIKGGHYEGDAIDILYDGSQYHTFVAERILTKNTHGTGCTLSSAIASNLARGIDIVRAVQLAKEYVTGAINDALELGKGNGPTNHFYKFYNKQGDKV